LGVLVDSNHNILGQVTKLVNFLAMYSASSLKIWVFVVKLNVMMRMMGWL